MSQFCAFDWGVRFNPYSLPIVENTSKRDKKTLIHDLRLLAQSRHDLVNARKDNEFLERFLKARKYVFNDSCDLYVNYYSFRQRNPDIFNRLNGQDVLIQQALRDGFPGVLDKRDRSLLLSLEFLIAEDINQHRGFVFIVDWTEFMFKQSSNLSPNVNYDNEGTCSHRTKLAKELSVPTISFNADYDSVDDDTDTLELFCPEMAFFQSDFVVIKSDEILKLMIEGLQDCFPAKFKGVHFIGQPWYVDVALSFIKPFLKEKSKDRIFLHGNNLGTLHQYVAKDVLPSELGGERPPFNPLPWAEKLMSQSLE